MKKLFPDDKQQRKGLVDFLDKKGFYIILILLIVVVGTTAVILSSKNLGPSAAGPGNDNNIPDKIVADQEQPTDIGTAASNVQSSGSPYDTAKAASSITRTDTFKDVPKTKTTDKAVAANAGNIASSSGKTAAPTQKPQPAPTQAAKLQNLAMPVFGQVILEFAMNRLVFSTTLEEWKTHTGADIAADRGTPVKAAADGTVLDIKKDPRFGITVIIQHAAGIKTVYCNLAGDDVVVPNQKVKQGEIIGSVGNTAAFEAAEQPHLHFEVLKNDEYVDPLLYLPKSTTTVQ